MLQELVILGGGGWFPAHGRHTASALLRGGEEAVMIDAGTGVARLMERPELLAGVRRLDILLTHFHLDHIAGLAYLPAVVACEQSTIWGPGELLYDTPTADWLTGDRLTIQSLDGSALPEVVTYRVKKVTRVPAPLALTDLELAGGLQ